MDNGINAKADIKEFGEVFTPDKIVNDMLDLIDEELPKDETYITKTFLEPACGDGQFLIRILYRKLLQVQKLPSDQQELALIKSLCSIYGVDIQDKNVEASRKRMKAILLGQEVTTFGRDPKAENKEVNEPIKIKLDIDITSIEKVIDYILTTNIMVGNTLEENQFSDSYIWLTSYNWDDDNNGGLVIAKCPISNPDYETNKEPISNYKELANRYTDDPIDVGDIAERYRGYPFWNESKEQTKADSKPKKNNKSANSTFGAYNL